MDSQRLEYNQSETHREIAKVNAATRVPVPAWLYSSEASAGGCQSGRLQQFSFSHWIWIEYFKYRSPEKPGRAADAKNGQRLRGRLAKAVTDADSGFFHLLLQDPHSLRVAFSGPLLRYPIATRATLLICASLVIWHFAPVYPVGFVYFLFL
jgi:hypothetical protein